MVVVGMRLGSVLYCTKAGCLTSIKLAKVKGLALDRRFRIWTIRILLYSLRTLKNSSIKLSWSVIISMTSISVSNSNLIVAVAPII